MENHVLQKVWGIYLFVTALTCLSYMSGLARFDAVVVVMLPLLVGQAGIAGAMMVRRRQ